MAASVGLTSTIIEPKPRLGGALWRIATIENALGGHRTGSSLATAMLADVERAAPDVVRAEATGIEATDRSVSVKLADGDRVTGKHAVVATGVAPLQPQDASWIARPARSSLPPLWDADPAGAAGQTWLVLGADRPLGTFLRANPDLAITLLVPFPPSDAYKADEVAGDPRVRLIPVDALTIDKDLLAQPGNLRGDQTFANIGVAPAPVNGLVHDRDGYCPMDGQHPRVHIAGDLRSPRGQRVQTAMGSGAEAALSAYYAMRIPAEAENKRGSSE